MNGFATLKDVFFMNTWRCKMGNIMFRNKIFGNVSTIRLFEHTCVYTWGVFTNQTSGGYYGDSPYFPSNAVISLGNF